MTNDLNALPKDTSLTYDNAKSKGYYWDMDVLRDDQGHIEDVDFIKQKVNEGYKLGESWAPDKYRAPYGLYKPLKKPVQLPKKV